MRFTLPKGWLKKKLVEIADVQTGIAKGKKNISDPVTRPYLRVANVQDGRLDLNEIKIINISRHEIDRFSLREGDVLFTEGGDFDKLGRGTVWRDEIPGCLHQNHVFAVRIKNGQILPYYLSTYASSFWGRTYFLSCSKQTTNLASINSTQLKAMPLPIPPLSEQAKITTILSTWDRAIELNEKLIAAKQKRKEALMQQLLTGSVRLPQFQRDEKNRAAGIVRVPAAVRRGLYPPSVQPGIPKITYRPDGWDEITIDKLLHIEKRPIELNDDEEYQLVVAKRNRGGIEPREKLRGYEVKTPTQFEVKSGDFVISKRQIIHGACGIVPTSLDGAVVSNEYSVCTVNGSLDMVFLKYLSHTLYFQQTCFQASVGVALEKMIFRLEQWLKFPFLIPPIDEQREIVSVLAAMDQEIDLLKNRSTLLSQQKKGLMQQLLTGKVRVNMENEK